MDIETLHLFSDVMHERSFTSIAKSRGIAASSVSRSISSLESEVKARLFQRTTRQIVPTEAGLLYFERIRVILEELDTANQLINDVNNRPCGTLRVTASNAFGETHLVPIMIEFNKLYPDLSLEFLLHDRFTDLVEERIDVAIRTGTLTDSTYIARQLSTMSLYVVASPSYLKINGTPTLPEQLNSHPCLIFPRNGQHANWSFKRDQRTQHIPIPGKHLITNACAIKDCTLAGMGLSLLPDWLIKEDIKKGKLIMLFNDYAVTDTDYDGAVWMLYPSREFLPTKVKVFREFLIEYFAQL